MGDFKKISAAESVVLVGVITPTQDEAMVEEYLDELEFLAHTAGAETHKRFVQRLQSPNPKTVLGSGKVNEVKEYVDEHEIDTVIFDDELSPSQLRNLEKILEKKVLDRANLILDIFAKRAQTAHAKTQVELAQYQYLLPRLTGMWTHLDRTKGGIGMRGPGETEIETDRRIIRDKIALLKKKLLVIDKQKATQRRNRGKMIRVALVGYTNVGKSTTMNLISKSKVFAENKLFATLDTTVRKVVIGNLPFLMADTVGFIRKLPHQLVESFKSTLDEVREADLLVHIADIAHPNFEDHVNVVNTTLQEIESGTKPTILLFNKIDNLTEMDGEFDLTGGSKPKYSLEYLKRTWMAKADTPVVFVSMHKKTGVDEFRKVLYEKVKELHIKRFPYNDFLFQYYDDAGSATE